MRFVAAFYVLVFHLDIRTPFKFLWNPLEEVVRRGALGVTIFFILSGFILTYTYQYRERSGSGWSFFKSFQVKRIARIYPAYLAAFLIFILVAALFRYRTTHQGLVIFLDAFMLNSWVPKLANKYFGGGGWSISTEFFFYLAFPLCLPIVQRLKSKRVVIAAAVVFALLSAAPGYLCQFFPNVFPDYLVYAFPPCRIAEFLCGVLTARLVFHFRVSVRPAIALTAVAVAAIYLAVFGFRFRSNLVNHQVFVPAAMLLIASLATFQEHPAFRWLSSRPMLYAGKISYSFYLVQMPIFLVVDCLIDNRSMSPVAFWTIPIIAGVTLLASIGLFHLVEHPAHLFLTKGTRSHKRRAKLEAEETTAV